MPTGGVSLRDVKGLGSTEDGDAEEVSTSAEARTWNSRPQETRERDPIRDDGSSRPAPEREPQTGNPERDWGVVLVILAAAVLTLAGAVSFSVLMGGILGVLSVRGAAVLTLLLVGIGLVGLRQGVRAYHGR